ncbi:MAG: hypothetical protein A3K67_05540 [Euryarchaeota archaeon RBG_16_62_10]|nr:MAG: hypothetical protein A3K67_05540 [Euryarchaeota archaeon RBG_16_62_10]
MCRMAGVVFRSTFPAEVLEDLREVARTGRIPDEPEPGHRDGWGVVSFVGGVPIYLERRADPIFDDKHFDPAVKQAAKLHRPNILIAHARASSGTPATIPNTHPFVVDGVVLAHNGTIFDFDAKTAHTPAGDTDSEKLAMALADRLHRTGDLRTSFKSAIVDEVLTREFSAAILLVSDGKQLLAYRDYGPKRSASYYDLKIARFTDHIVVYQETAMRTPENVYQVKKGELVTIGLDLEMRKETVR